MRRAFLADVVEWGVSVTYDHLRLVQAPLYFDGARTREQGLWAPAGLQPGRPRSSPRIAKSCPRWRLTAITPAPAERPRWAWA